MELSTRAQIILAKHPYIANIQEGSAFEIYGTVEHAEQVKAVFYIPFQFHIAGLVREYFSNGGIIFIRAGPQGAQAPGPQAHWAASCKLAYIGQHLGFAVRNANPGINTGSQ